MEILITNTLHCAFIATTLDPLREGRGALTRDWNCEGWNACFCEGTFHFRLVSTLTVGSPWLALIVVFLERGMVPWYNTQRNGKIISLILCTSVCHISCGIPTAKKKKLTDIIHISLASFFLCKHQGTESVSFVQIRSVKLEPWILFSWD